MRCAAFGALPKVLSGRAARQQQVALINCASLKLGLILSKESTSLRAVSSLLLETASRLSTSNASMLRESRGAGHCSAAMRRIKRERRSKQEEEYPHMDILAIFQNVLLVSATAAGFHQHQRFFGRVLQVAGVIGLPEDTRAWPSSMSSTLGFLMLTWMDLDC